MMAEQKSKKTKGSLGHRAKCAAYRARGQREKNKLRKLKRIVHGFAHLNEFAVNIVEGNWRSVKK